MSRFILYRKNATTHSPIRCRLGKRGKALLRGDRLDVHPPPRSIEAHLAVDEREDCVIPAQAYVLAGKELRPALANNDVAGKHNFAAKFFHTQPLADAVPAVLDAA